MILDSFQSLSYSSLFGLAIVLGFATANAKAIPLAHTIRLLPSLYRLLKPRLSSAIQKAASTQPPAASISYNAALPALFKHHAMASRAVAFDLDVNIHKSNSTFFADADISRAKLLAGMLSESLAHLGPANFILAGVQCKFQREIRPYQSYTISSRILAWNDKTLYVVTYFLKPGTRLSVDLEVRGGPGALAKDEKLRKNVFATMITKYVFKAGRTTVSPEAVLERAGFLIDTEGNDKNPRSDEMLGAEDIGLIVKVGLEYVAQCMA